MLKEFKAISDDVFLISAATGKNVNELVNFMSQKVDEIEKPVTDVVVEDDLGAFNNDDSAFEVIRITKDSFAVDGGKIKRLAQVTDARNHQQVLRLQNILTGMGVFEELKKQGIKDGDTVVIGHLELIHYDD